MRVRCRGGDGVCVGVGDEVCVCAYMWESGITSGGRMYVRVWMGVEDEVCLRVWFGGMRVGMRGVDFCGVEGVCVWEWGVYGVWECRSGALEGRMRCVWVRVGGVCVGVG